MKALSNIRFSGRCAIAAVVALAMACGTAPAPPFTDSFFDVFVGESVGPPYPSQPPIQVRVQNEMTPGGATVETEIVSMSLAGTTPMDIPLRMQGSDAGGSAGHNGLESFFDIFTEGEFPAESFFDVFVEIDLPGLTASPSLRTAPTVLPAESFFDVFVEVDLPGMAVQRHTIRCYPGPGIVLGDVSVRDVNLRDSFFDVFCELRTTDDYTLDVEPVLSMTMTGRYVPEPGTLLLLAVGGGVVLIRRRSRR